VWIIRDDRDEPVGWPKPLVFKTKKDAKVRLQKIVHQARGGFGELRVCEISEEALKPYMAVDKEMPTLKEPPR
jgi:hypothetical protein